MFLVVFFLMEMLGLNLAILQIYSFNFNNKGVQLKFGNTVPLSTFI